jgi:hypothetical protein
MRRRKVSGGKRPDGCRRQLETAWSDLPTSLAVAAVPPRASITSEGEVRGFMFRGLYTFAVWGQAALNKFLQRSSLRLLVGHQ